LTRPPSVLVADYVDHTARSWSDALAHAGFVVHCCRPLDVRPALLQAYRTQALILAISCLRTPISYSDLDGRRVPVIVVSADPNDRRRASGFGCELILPRPTRAANVVQAVRGVLGAAATETPRPPQALAWTAREWSSGSALRARSRQLCDHAFDLRRRAAELLTAAEGLVDKPGCGIEVVPRQRGAE
jgi:DNA-binding response OmpR family regulator